MRTCALLLSIILIASIPTIGIASLDINEPPLSPSAAARGNNSTEPATFAILDLEGNFSTSTVVDGAWTANLSSDLSISTSLLNDSDLRLDHQIDLHLGDNDSNLSQSEWDAFVVMFAQQNITTLDGRAWLDDNSFSATSGITLSAIEIDATLPQAIGENSSWTWSESGDFSSTRGFLPSALLTINQATGVLHGTPLTVTTESPTEYRWAPDKVDVSGTPDNFTLLQNVTTSGTYTVTIASNTDPVTDIEFPDNQDVAIRWDLPTNFTGDVQDAGLPTTECEWNFTTPTGTHFMNGVSVSLEPDTIESWQPGEYMEATFTCTDFHGASTSSNHTWGLDAAAPVLTWVNATEVGCGLDDVEPAKENIINCDGLTILSGAWLSFSVVAGDDFTASPSIIWTSNKTPNWTNEGISISAVFYQGANVNGFDDDLPDRHNAKENSTFVFNLTVTDDAGHAIEYNWPVRLLDNTPPATKINLWVNETLVTGSSPVRVGDTIRVDLNESFDDINAVTDVRWWAMIDDEPIDGMQDVGWETIREFNIGPLEVGLHKFNITAEDTSGNRAENNSYNIQVYPLSVLDLKIVNVTVAEVDEWVVAPGEISVIVWVSNGGDFAGGFRICVENQCSNQSALAATPDGPGFSSHYVKFDVEKGNDLTVRIEWEDSEGNMQTDVHETDIRIDQPYSAVEWFGIIVAVLGIVVLLYLLKKEKSN